MIRKIFSKKRDLLLAGCKRFDDKPLVFQGKPRILPMEIVYRKFVHLLAPLPKNIKGFQNRLRAQLQLLY